MRPSLWPRVRLFVGIPVPSGATYQQVGRELVDIVPKARPVRDGTWHITVRFLGEMRGPGPVEHALKDALRGRPALPCVVEGIGAFPDPKKARILWAGVRAPGIEALAQVIEDSTARLGEPPERRKFVAHVTLGRLQQDADLRSFVDRHKDTLFGTGIIDRVVLFRSILSPVGSTYEKVREFMLGDMTA